MPALAITGTIGSGKSSSLKLISCALRTIGHETTSFSADEENRRLLDQDPEVRDLICSQFGNSCYQNDGTADRAAIFQIIATDPLAKKRLEEILHPRIEILWKPQAIDFHSKKDTFFVAEIPLLYEKQLESFFDKTLLIGCSENVRRERLERTRSMKSSDAARWTNMQQSQELKIPKADHLFWNDGSEQSLKLQVQYFVDTIALK